MIVSTPMPVRSDYFAYCSRNIIGNLEADDIRILRDNITIETTSVSFMQCEPLFDIIDDANYEFSEFVNVTANVDDFDLDMTLTFGVIDPEGMSS